MHANPVIGVGLRVWAIVIGNAGSPRLPHLVPVRELGRVRVTDTVFADALKDSPVVPPVQGPLLHVVISRVMDHTSNIANLVALMDVAEVNPIVRLPPKPAGGDGSDIRIVFGRIGRIEVRIQPIRDIPYPPRIPVGIDVSPEPVGYVSKHIAPTLWPNVFRKAVPTLGHRFHGNPCSVK